MAATSTREYRRFTAVMVIHPALQSPADVSRLLPKSINRLNKLKDLPAGWEGVRTEFLLPRRSFYPEHLISKESRKRGDAGYAHDIYVATKDLGGQAGRVTLIASPYVELLVRVIEALEEAVPEPGVQFADVAMPTVYRWLDADEGSSSLVNRVTMQIVGEPYADLVSLSGKRPLHSMVHDKLKSVTVPYGLGVRISNSGIDCRVSIDRHGAVHWFQTTEVCVVHPMKLIDDHNAAGAFRKVRRLPLMREAKDKIVEPEPW